MAWFRVASDRLTYRGRLSRESYAAWAKTAEGSAAIAARAGQHRFWVFAATRARRRIWRELELAGRDESLSSGIQAAADRFTAQLVETSHAPGLLRRTIALHRLVIVPRTLVAARTRHVVRKRLHSSAPLDTLDSPVRDFFCEQLVVEFDAALAERRPSVPRPVLTHDGWRCVGYDPDYEWVDPMFSGPGWGGHLLMFEFPRDGLSRAARKELDRAVEELRNTLKGLSHAQRHEIMQTAVDGLSRMTA